MKAFILSTHGYFVILDISLSFYINRGGKVTEKKINRKWYQPERECGQY